MSDLPLACKMCAAIAEIKCHVICAFLPALVTSLFHGAADAQVLAAMIGVSFSPVLLMEPDQ